MFDRIAQSVTYQQLELNAPVTVTVKRLDQIHPQISGNKFFKLKYNFLEAEQQGFKKVLTFGGAYSNHIAATAYAAQLFGFASVGIIRGEELKDKALNHTLATAQQLGMHLHFISRQHYREKNSPVFLEQLQQHYPEHYLIPEGGTNTLAIQGCKEILTAQDRHNYDVICCAVGTGGTMTGLIEASSNHQHILGFSALKGDFLKSDVQQWTSKQNWQISDAYCCGGYAKTSPELFQFMQSFENQHHLPLEQVYTAKMMYGLMDLIGQNHFPAGSRILVIHTGGLQGRHTNADPS